MSMANAKAAKQRKIRNIEYYDTLEVFDELYAQSKNGKKFDKLMKIIKSDENIKLAFRNIKRNTGSNTKGTDNLTIKDIEKMSEREYVRILKNKLTWYKPKAVKRVEIPKSDGRKRPLGIPTITDRLVQQCILQVLEPICEARFYNYSYGFRPNRSAEHAIARCQNLMQLHHMHYVVDIDIKGFFDNVNHSKLIKQLWSIGIRDKQLLCIIKEMLKSPIVMPDGRIEYPTKGTPQGGILSPLLSNIVLNELDWWIASQWENNPIVYKYKTQFPTGYTKSAGYKVMKKTNLKEVSIVRYADDFKIFCRNKNDADKIFIAAKQWLQERLKLEINEDKSQVVNLKRKYSYYLGFKLKVIPKAGKLVVRSHMCEKAMKNVKNQLKEQIKCIQRSKNIYDEALAIDLYNSKVIGIHNYYRIATHISIDCGEIGFSIRKILYNRLGHKLTKKGMAKGFIYRNYAKSTRLKYIGCKPVCPIGYIQNKHAINHRKDICKYTLKGREEIHKLLGVNMNILHKLMSQKEINRSIEYMDNRISLYSAQHGKCAVTQRILKYEDIHCHHKIPRYLGGNDKYQNLIIVNKNAHILIHATDNHTIRKYLKLTKLTKPMLDRLNQLRLKAQLEPINA